MRPTAGTCSNCGSTSACCNSNASGRPDGERPGGEPTFFDYLKTLALGDDEFVLDEDQCRDADREFMQFYHRRVCWMAVGEYLNAVRDADHTLAFMDFVRDHSPNEEFTRAHEHYRGFVLFHRTQAAAADKAEKGTPPGRWRPSAAGRKRSSRTSPSTTRMLRPTPTRSCCNSDGWSRKSGASSRPRCRCTTSSKRR